MMPRTPEPELMNDEQQALAYAQADFSEPHNHCVELLKQSLNGKQLQGKILDLGCGPADICIRIARAFPNVKIMGIDAAPAMLSLGRKAISEHKLEQRIQLLETYLPSQDIQRSHYAAITSNSLLHHLADPMTLWQCIQQYAQPGTHIFIMDLMRPPTESEAKRLLKQYAASEPAILQHDFYHSLLAAYTPDEVAKQLTELNINCLTIDIASDRHFTVHGTWR